MVTDKEKGQNNNKNNINIVTLSLLELLIGAIDKTVSLKI